MDGTEVFIRVVTEQCAVGSEPEVMDLTTEGTMRRFADRLELTYKESAATGLDGVVTTFSVYGDRIVLTRDGEALKNTMTFRVGEGCDSLYDLGFGALLVTVTAQSVETDLPHGKFEVRYTVEVEHTTAGHNHFTVTFRPKRG